MLEIAAIILATTVSAPDATQKAILDAARPPAEAALGRKVWFRPKQVKTVGTWAFVLAEMQDAHGRPIDYYGTPKAAQADAGFLSKDYAALLERRQGTWRIVADAVGPTDVAWATWPAKHGAPESVFAK